jgi:NADH dehydrogenase
MIERDEELVTVFGGDGFIGRYVCEFLARSGARIRVASRNPRNSYFLQPLAQIGRFGLVKADIRKPDEVVRALDGATAAVNLCGVFGRQMEVVHVEGARNIAEGARKAGVGALAHVSAIGADPQSESNYGRTKGEGELAVRKAFKAATILRPSLAFGPEDKLTNRFAAMGEWSSVPVLAGQRKFQPVYVRDLAQAVARAALDPGTHGGKTYEIGGPQVMTMVELHKAIFELSGQDADVVELPDWMGSLMAAFGFLPGAPLTRDQWLMLKRDNVVAKGAPGLEAFGIDPAPLGAVGYEWLGRYRKGGKFAGRRINLTATS